MKHIRYLRYVLTHKWYVFLAGAQLGVPLHRLILHDWTKFLPREWLPYTNFFYGGGLSREEAADLDYDFRVSEDVELAFERAWLHHQNKNDHHWQYWVRLGDDGTELVLEMPDVCQREMLADWRGAGRALGKPDTLVWYIENRDNMRLHPSTRHWIEIKTGFMAIAMEHEFDKQLS